MRFWLTTMADVLRNAGLHVHEIEGWQTRSYLGWPQGFDTCPTYVMCHHTASKTTPANDIAYMLRGPANPTKGRPNLAPIGNLLLDRHGVYHVLAAGQATTNGIGTARGWHGLVPDNTMNHHSIAIEAANAGTGEPWPKEQTDAYVAGVAALCVAYHIPVAHVRAHAEWSPGRKIDPAGPSPWATGRHTWNMAKFRADVAAHMLPPTGHHPAAHR